MRRALIAADTIAVCASWFGVMAVASVGDDGRQPLSTLLGWALAATMVTIVALRREQLYLTRVLAIRAVEVQRAGRAGVVAAVIVLAVDVAVAGPVTPLRTLLAIGVAGLLVVWSRAAVETWIEASGRRALRHRSLLVTGSVASARRVLEVLSARPELGTRVTGVVAPQRPEPTLPVPWVGTLDDLPVLLRLTGATGVAVVGSTLDPPQLATVLRAVQSLDVRADLITLDDADSPQFRVLPLSSRGAVGNEPALSATQRIGKRAFDLVAGAALAVVALPVVLTAAALLKIATGGPVFVQEVEQGPRAELVTLRRLRTRHLPDTRLARWVGTVCRRLCIDELPQLGNVLAGSMTLVGPRPRPTGHTVTPVDMSAGLIGLRHVERSDLPALRAHRRTDEFYIENWSVGLDLSIIAASASEVAWRTVREMVVRGEQRETVAV